MTKWNPEGSVIGLLRAAALRRDISFPWKRVSPAYWQIAELIPSFFLILFFIIRLWKSWSLFSQILNCIHNTTPGLKKSMADSLVRYLWLKSTLFLSFRSLICNSAPRLAARDMNNVSGAVWRCHSESTNLLKQTQIGKSLQSNFHSFKGWAAGRVISLLVLPVLWLTPSSPFCVCACRVGVMVFAVHDTWYCTKLIFSFILLYWGGDVRPLVTRLTSAQVLMCVRAGRQKILNVCHESQCSRGNLRHIQLWGVWEMKML